MKKVIYTAPANMLQDYSPKAWKVAGYFFPKSQVTINRVGLDVEITMPEWLASQKRLNVKPAPQVETAAQAEAPQSDVPKATPGVYESDGEVFIVKLNREKTGVYAKKLVVIGGSRLTEAGTVVQIDFEYSPGAVYKLREEHRMPLARAQELTVKYGKCINCGLALKDAKSVARGIGPVCMKAFTAHAAKSASA
jgi:hypothetical protein